MPSPCSGRSQTSCSPPECKWASGAKKSYCRSGQNAARKKTAKKGSPGQEWQKSYKKKTAKKGSPDQQWQKSYKKKTAKKGSPDQQWQYKKKAPGQGGSSSSSSPCARLPFDSCSPPTCKWASGAKLSYCRRAPSPPPQGGKKKFHPGPVPKGAWTAKKSTPNHYGPIIEGLDDLPPLQEYIMEVDD